MIVRLLIPFFRVLGLTCTAFQCNTKFDNQEVEARNWKYGQGLHIGDLITFDGSSYRQSRDTIFRYNTAIAKIRELEKRTGDDIMVIESLDGNHMGTYYSK